MATQGRRKTPAGKGNLSSSNYSVPPVYMDANRVRSQDWESVMGWIAACVLVILLLPIMGMMLVETLEARHETKRALQKLEKIEQRIERKEREKDRKEPDSVINNIVFDRVRRPFSLPLSRPKELE